MGRGLLTIVGILGAFVAIFATGGFVGWLFAGTSWDVLAVPVMILWVIAGLWLLSHWQIEY